MVSKIKQLSDEDKDAEIVSTGETMTDEERSKNSGGDRNSKANNAESCNFGKAVAGGESFI